MPVLEFSPAALRKIRQRSGLGQRRLARIVGCSVSLVGHYENGRSAPSVGRLAVIARALGASMDDFMHEVAE